MGLKATVLPLHYGVPQRCGAAIYRAGPSVSADAQMIEGARLKAAFRILSGWNAVQALENVTTAGIYVLEYAYQSGSHTRGNDEFE
jgi:hypothetical protein